LDKLTYTFTITVKTRRWRYSEKKC